jgi:Cu2+-exporting ATPase
VAHQLLREAGLDRFYQLRAGTTLPSLCEIPARAGALTWLEPLLEAARAAAPQDPRQDAIIRLVLDVQGIQCAACVWLLEQLYQRRTGALEIRINPGIGSMELLFRPEFDVRGYVQDILPLGYRVGPPCKKSDGAFDDLLVRLGVCAALAMNSMIFSFALYFGLSAQSDPVLHRIFSWANWLLAIASVLVGGSVFLQSAARALRRGILHMDVPIALGILLAFAGSTWSFFGNQGAASYFDTLNVFITLMLLGRLLQRRVASANRQVLLADDGIEGLCVRRIGADQRVDVVPVRELRAGDTLLLLPGELLPVRSQLLDTDAAFSLQWVSGEAEPALFRAGQAVLAGAHNAQPQALRLRAEEAFAASALCALLARPTATALLDRQESSRRGFWHQLSRFYVAGVLALALLALLLWWHAGALRALSVVVSVLVVTCPCAIGLATPLAYELVQARLRRLGLFVREPSFLDRALRVRHVVFDKTGTLTLGDLVLAAPFALQALPAEARAALYQLVTRSNHPKSRALFTALHRLAEIPTLDATAQVREEPGRGLWARIGGHEYRLGGAAYALGQAMPTATPAITPDATEAAMDELCLSRDGDLLGRFPLREELRCDAAAEVAALRAAGLKVSLLSGDAPARVQQLARQLGLPLSDADGGRSPADKAAFVRAVDQMDTLMVGDGVNDALAMTAAYCAGTPATDRCCPSAPTSTSSAAAWGRSTRRWSWRKRPAPSSYARSRARWPTTWRRSPWP